MRVLEWQDLLTGRTDVLAGAWNATIGVFDGLHLGHRSLVDLLQVRDNPLYPDAGPLVITFRTSPKKVLQLQYPGDLMTWERKLATLEALGVEVVVAIDFSADFGKMAGRDFFLVLKKSIVFSKLVLGWNFSFGSGSGTTASDLGWLADPQTRLTVVPPFVVAGEAVSSSRIRRALASGDIFLANQLLGREYDLPVTSHRRLGTLLRAPKNEFETLVPANGLYQCRLNDRTTLLTVNETDLTWESPPGERLEHIVFVQGVQNGT